MIQYNSKIDDIFQTYFINLFTDKTTSQMSESYFFALCPKYLKIEHSFAKNIKPQTRYKLAVFKGIQKCDQMKQQVRPKIVGGKIEFPSLQLHFNITFFNPVKNIQFHVKLYQQKPNQEDKQIGSYIILSSDYIKMFKTKQKSHFQISGMLLNDLSIDFDLFVQKSKCQLNQNVQKYLSQNSNNKEKNNQEDDSKSQKSQLSRQFVRIGDGFISPNRRLQRKRSPENRPCSRAKSINKSERSFTSPVSPRKVQKTNQLIKQEPKIQTQQNTYQYQPSNSLKFKNTNQIFDIELQKNKASPVKSPRNIQSSKLKPIQTKEETNTFKIQVKPSPRANEVIKSTIYESPDSREIKSPGNYQPRRQLKVDIKQSIENQTTVFPQIKISITQNLDPKISILGTQNSSQQKKQTRKSGATLLTSDHHFAMQESNIRIVMEQSGVHYPVPRLIQNTEPTLTLQVQQKRRQPDLIKTLEDSRNDFLKTSNWQRSIRSTQLVRSQIQEQQKSKDKNFEERKTQVIYAIFLLISVFLIYNAMTPTRRI